jgi:hypothetical protein
MASISLPKGYQRLDAFPLDDTAVFATLADLQAYAATNGSAYTGQICSVSGTNLAYIIRSDKSVDQIGGGTPVQHSHSISDVSDLQSALAGKQPVGNYASLGGDGKIPAAQLPSYVDDVLEAQMFTDLPPIGESGKIYVALDTLKTYRWAGSTYVEISASPGSTDAVPEGTTHKYYTDARAAAAAPVQSVAGKTGAVALAITDVVNLQSTLDAKELKTVFSDSAPLSPISGQRWVDTKTLRAYQYCSSAWVEIACA